MDCCSVFCFFKDEAPTECYTYCHTLSRHDALPISIDGRLAAIVAVADPIKPSTPAAIAALHQLGLKVAMITGDNEITARAIAARLDIDEVVAEKIGRAHV